MPTWNMIMLQDPGTLVMMLMSKTHNILMEVMSTIAMFILVLMIWLFKNKYTNREMTQNNSLEIIWTILPLLILIYMAIPSLRLLYLLEETFDPLMTVKALGHQWYWTYEYPDINKSFDSFMETNIEKESFRLMDVDNRLIIPYRTFTRILCSSTDVIHSWAVPSMGIKMDAMPGRLNQTTLYPIWMGVYFGQCSEICGMNHSFMPIVLEITSNKLFIKWAKNLN